MTLALPDRSAPPDAALEIRLLGAPEWGSSAVVDSRAAVLVAMIVLDGPLPRNRAAEIFWPQAEGKGRTNLRVLLHRVQQALGTRVFATGDRLTLLPHVTVDLAGTDDELVERCLQLGPSNTTLLGGVVLAELADASRWLSEARRQVEQRVIRAHVAWLDARNAPEDLPQAGAVADAIVSLDPLSEIGYRQQMRVRAARGDRAGALAAFEQCRRELKEQLGTSPDPQTTALHRALLRVREPAGLADGLPSARPLLQREGELADMEKALAARRIVIVEGPSGSGKTALLRQFARQRSDFYWAASPADGASPLAGLARLAAHLAPLATQAGAAAGTAPDLAGLDALRQQHPDELPAADVSALARRAAAVAGLLHQAGYRTLVIDDVHLLDDATLDVMAQVLHASWELMPWCDFVLAYRPVRARRKVRLLCEKLALDGRLRLIHPSPLRRDAVLALMDPDAASDPASPARADRLVVASGGTPGVLVELLALQSPLADDGRPALLPPQIRSILLERLRACSSTAEGLAQLASVAGSSFSVGLAAAIAGLSSWKVAEKWNELLLAGVFDARGFAFPLVELAVHDSVPDAVRQFMHAEVAKALAREGAPPERLAFHWLKAGDPVKAGPFARAAAADCLHTGQLDGAIAALEAVVFTPSGACADHDPVALLQLAALYLQIHRLDRITEVLEAAARTPGSPLERGACTALGGRTLLAMGQHAAASASLASALPLVESDPVLQRAVGWWAARAAQLAGEPCPAGIAMASDADPAFGWDPNGIPVHTPADGRRCVADLQTERPGTA